MVRTEVEEFVEALLDYRTGETDGPVSPWRALTVWRNNHDVHIMQVAIFRKGLRDRVTKDVELNASVLEMLAQPLPSALKQGLSRLGTESNRLGVDWSPSVRYVGRTKVKKRTLNNMASSSSPSASNFNLGIRPSV